MNSNLDENTAKTCWFVGATYGSDDQTPRFLREGIWENGYTDRYLELVKSARPGECIAIKASYTRKHGLPFDNRGRSVSIMGIKAIGVITENPGDGRTLKVRWETVEPQREWYFYTLMKMIWRVSPDAWEKEALIDFTFSGKAQDIDRFRNAPYWRDRFGDNAPSLNAFKWTNFYEAVADKLLTFRHRREDLVAAIHKIFAKKGMAPLLDKFKDGSKGPLKDICPFTVMGIFNRNLTDENRILVQYGLEMLGHTQRIGLQEMLDMAGIAANEVTEETVGFQIAPRLNALGRLDDPNPAIDLLTGFDDEEAHEIALMIHQKNEERKEIVQSIYEEAKTMVDPEKKVQVLAKEGWNPGILGIVAGRLLEELGQTVIVLNIEDGRAKGSARSVEAVDIFEALDPHRDLFIAFGGHAGAAGMTLEVEKLSDLSQVLEDYVCEKGADANGKNKLNLDEELDLETLSLETVKSFERLAPFGMDNQKPVFYIRDFQVESARTMGAGNAHLKLKISKGEASFEVVAFGQGRWATEFVQTKNLELAVTLSVNQWNGQTALQLMMVDARVEGVQLFNIRGKNVALPEGVPVLDFSGEVPDLATSDAVVVKTIPEDITLLKTIFQEQHFSAVYFKNDIDKAYYLTGYGTREQFAKLYKTIYQFPEFDIRYKLKDLATYLNIQQILLVKMIQVFEELGFVTIKDGVMTVNKEAPKREIAESQIYQNLKQTVKDQEIMALGTVQEMYNFLMRKE